MPVLLTISGPHTGARFSIEKDSLVGRSSDCHLRINDSRMSRRHARFAVDSEGMKIDDLGSRNGTFLNGIRIRGQSQLLPGDRVRAGETLWLVEPDVDLVPARYTSGVIFVSETDETYEPLKPRQKNRTDPDLISYTGSLAENLSNCNDIPGLYVKGLENIAEYLGADFGAIISMANLSRRLVPAAVIGTEIMAVDRMLFQHVLSTGEFLLISRKAGDIQLGQEPVIMNSRLLMAVPLKNSIGPGAVLMLEVETDPGISPWNEDTLVFACHAAALIGAALDRVRATERLSGEKDYLLRCGTSPRESVILGNSSTFRNLLQELARAAISEKPVILEGEPGSGRTLLSSFIHARSARASGPYICFQYPGSNDKDSGIALTGEESEDDSIPVRVGAIESADGGSLFISGTNKLTRELRNYLVSVNAEKMLLRKNGKRRIFSDTRFIFSIDSGLISDNDMSRDSAGLNVLSIPLFSGHSASHSEISSEKDIGDYSFPDKTAHADAALQSFSSGVFSRRDYIFIRIPPLRERREDIGLLFSHFARETAKTLGFEEPVYLTREGLAAAEEYNWPGNIREMKNLVEWMSFMYGSGAAIGQEQIAAGGRNILSGFASAESVTLQEQVSALERSLIEQAFRDHGKKVLVAEKLGISRPTLDKKMAIYGIGKP